MHRSFETPGHVAAVVECEAGLVDIACRAVSVTEVTLEAESPGGIELIEGSVVVCSPSVDGHLLSVRIPHQHLRGRQRHGEVQVRIVVPLGADVDVSTASAPIRVHGLVGRATFKTASGSVEGDDAAGSVRAESASGNIALGAVEGEVRAQSASGDVRIGTAARRAVLTTISGTVELAGAAADLEVRTTSGRIDLGALHGDATVGTVSGDIRVGSQNRGRIQMRTVSGDVSVGIAEGVTLRVDVDSISGRVRSEIPISDTLPGEDASPTVSLVVRTVSGDVTLDRAGAPALHE
jgi:DUF4097 and DUF4098 domain-containing protein YvlB